MCFSSKISYHSDNIKRLSKTCMYSRNSFITISIIYPMTNPCKWCECSPYTVKSLIFEGLKSREFDKIIGMCSREILELSFLDLDLEHRLASLYRAGQNILIGLRQPLSIMVRSYGEADHGGGTIREADLILPPSCTTMRCP